MFSNIEEPYDELAKYLNSAIIKLFYGFSRGAKNWRNEKINALPSQKTLSGLQMELSLDKIVWIVLGVKYAKDCKIQSKLYLIRRISQHTV